jgi:hypothetical protein
MQRSKRVIFFVTLIAFLSNLAFGMSLPLVQQHNDQAAATQADYSQYKHPSNEQLSFSACEFLEEIEEAEQEADFDAFSLHEKQSIFNQHFAVVFFDTNFNETAHPEFTGRNFRNWLYKNNITIYFQVFRI